MNSGFSDQRDKFRTEPFYQRSALEATELGQGRELLRVLDFGHGGSPLRLVYGLFLSELEGRSQGWAFVFFPDEASDHY
jgi:hypothetical protein